MRRTETASGSDSDFGAPLMSSASADSISFMVFLAKGELLNSFCTRVAARCAPDQSLGRPILHRTFLHQKSTTISMGLSW